MSSRFDDDDDWVGTPPEGRISRERADPDYWKRSWPMQTIFFGVLAVLVVVVVILALT
jgi:hypothetical protein